MDFRLRPWRLEDAPSTARWANDLEVARWLRDVFPNPYTLQDAEVFIQICLEAGENNLYRAIEIDGQAVGSIALARGVDVYQKNAELGYWMGREFHGKGVMTQAVREICRMGFAQWDIGRIYAEPYAGNAGSRRVLEKAGFQLEGVLRRSVYKLGETQDSCMYSLLRGMLGGDDAK